MVESTYITFWRVENNEIVNIPLDILLHVLLRQSLWPF